MALNVLYNWLKKHFPDFVFPKDGVLQFQDVLLPRFSVKIIVDISNQFILIEESDL